MTHVKPLQSRTIATLSVIRRQRSSSPIHLQIPWREWRWQHYSQVQREVGVDLIILSPTLLTTYSDAAVHLTLHGQGVPTEDVVATFSPEVFANDRVDYGSGGELPRLINYGRLSNALIAQTVMVFNAEQDPWAPQGTDRMWTQESWNRLLSFSCDSAITWFRLLHFWCIFDELYLLQIFTDSLVILAVESRLCRLGARQFIESETPSLLSFSCDSAITWFCFIFGEFLMSYISFKSSPIP
jgi:hypothetical protein